MDMKYIMVMVNCVLLQAQRIFVRKKEGFRPVSFKKLYPEWYAKYEEIKKNKKAWQKPRFFIFHN